MKQLYSFVIATTICASAYSQCLTISCNSNTTTNNDNGQCGAVVSYMTPGVTSYTCIGSAQDTFDYTGAQQTWVVPPGVTTVTIQTWGAQGGANWVNNNNFGGYVAADIAVTPGSTLYIYVGGQATTTAGGFNGGGTGEGAGKGGGGGTDVRIGGTTYNDRVVVAGGGGGAGYWSNWHVVGGQGGGLTGGDGYRDPNFATNPGGKGGTQTAGGADGTCVNFNIVACAGGFGYGGSITGCGCEVYGGGGGWYGGAASGNCRGGGGGSGYAIPSATNVVMNTGVRAGNGRVIIGYTGSPPPVTQTAGLPSGSLFPIGTTTNTFTSTDGINTATCSFDITVVDAEDPVLAGVPSAISQANDAAMCGANVSWTPITATDNCSATVTTNAVSGSFFPVGTSVVSVMAMDPSGNMDTTSFTVTVSDTEPPVISNVPSNITTSNDSAMCTAVVTWTTPTGADNCSATLVSNITSGSAFPVGTTIVTYIATDPSGNSDTATFTVAVNDTELPVVVCPANVTVSTDPGMCSASNVTLGSVSVTDNCTATSINDAPSVFPVGTTVVTYTATDLAGNSATCSQSVTVTDNEAPVIMNCPPNATGCPGILIYPVISASDNCGVSVTQVSGPPSGSFFATGVHTTVWVASDSAGNTDTCTLVTTILPEVTITTSNPPVVCVTDGNLTLNASPSGGIWSGTAVTGNVFSPSTAGVGQYYLTYFINDSTNCYNGGYDTITVSPCVGINELGAVSFSLYPNPANTSITFNSVEQGTLVLIDALGNVVLTKSIVDTNTQIAIEGIATGVYLARFTSTSGIISTSRLQIQR